MRFVLAVTLVLATLVSACASGTGTTQPSEPAGVADFEVPFDPPSEVARELLRPLAGIGSCTATPDPATDAELPAGLVVPDDAIVTSVEPADPITNVQGYIPWTPVQYRVWLQFVAPDVEVLQIEDEIREAEALVTDGSHRMFVKAQAVCETGSVFVAVVAPEVSDATLPTPSGTASAAP